MKLRSNARTLKVKAVSSLKSAVVAFNSPVEDGRSTAVLLHLQHSFEMLLKAALQQVKTPVFDNRAISRIREGRRTRAAVRDAEVVRG